MGGAAEVEELSLEDNFVIKGNNLLALHSLKKVYAGKVKLIYIDPPFNTEGDDFDYNDKFNHSTWLTFMKNRLEVAKSLLSRDGLIFVHLDYNEVHYMKILMDEVFGRENLLNEIIWAYKERETSKRFFNRKHDNILFYAKDSNSNYIFNYDSIREEYSEVTKGKFKYSDSEGRRYRLRTKDGRSDPGEENENTYRQHLDEEGGPLPRDWFVMPFVNQAAKERVFSTQKPESLLLKLIKATTNTGDLVLDFFAGSGTTGVVAQKIDRQFIMVEQMEGQLEIMLKRLGNVIEGEQGGISKEVEWQGGGSFTYAELMEYNAKYISEIEEADTKQSLQQIWQRMQENAFLSYKVSPAAINKEKEAFDELSLDEQKQFLVEVLDKNQLYVNYSEIEDEEYGISEELWEKNRQFYSLK